MVSPDFDFSQAVFNGKIVDKDSVMDDLSLIGSLYQIVARLSRKDAGRMVNSFEKQFLEGDRLQQVESAQRISQVKSGLIMAGRQTLFRNRN